MPMPLLNYGYGDPSRPGAPDRAPTASQAAAPGADGLLATDVTDLPRTAADCGCPADPHPVRPPPHRARATDALGQARSLHG